MDVEEATDCHSHYNAYNLLTSGRHTISIGDDVVFFPIQVNIKDTGLGLDCGAYYQNFTETAVEQGKNSAKFKTLAVVRPHANATTKNKCVTCNIITYYIVYVFLAVHFTS
ncbi:hypothetical protein FF2_036157 [Malus domestica]